jgi:hypothetical protein
MIHLLVFLAVRLIGLFMLKPLTCVTMGFVFDCPLKRVETLKCERLVTSSTLLARRLSPFTLDMQGVRSFSHGRVSGIETKRMDVC